MNVPPTTNALEVDHAFVACAPGAPEVGALLELGLVEGSRNTHPGQGTANRRFFFENFMLEFVWVADEAEATSAQTRRTRLWERCSNRQSGHSPFGIIFRPVSENASPPFQTWPYRPRYMPPDLPIGIAVGTTLEEPELFYLPVLRSQHRGSEPTDHALPLRRVQGVAAGVPDLAGLSAASRSAERMGLVRYFESPAHVLEISFEGPPLRLDLRPVLPLVFCAAGGADH